MPRAGVLEVHIPTTEIRSPRSRTLAPIPWSGLQRIPGLIQRVVPLVGAGQFNVWESARANKGTRPLMIGCSLSEIEKHERSSETESIGCD